MNSTTTLTKKQAEILAFIKDFHRENNFAPSYREIAAHLGISSPATVCEHVKNLERKGYLNNLGGARSLEPEQETEKPEALLLPLKGIITAGEPIEAVETAESITVPESMVRRPERSYVLQVRGESMIEDGILSGDYVVVEDNPSPRDGEIVVALIDGEAATLKRLYREAGRVRLQPANRAMKPFFVKNVAVQGVVRGLFRQYSPI
jgi:repressor LexA